jgi:hypothetical protein
VIATTKGGIPHRVHDSPYLTDPLNTSSILTSPSEQVGDWFLKGPYECKVKISNTDVRPVLLMLLLTIPSNPGPNEPGYYLLPVGQECSGSGGTEIITPESCPTPHYCTVIHEKVRYHVILVKPDKAMPK